MGDTIRFLLNCINLLPVFHIVENKQVYLLVDISKTRNIRRMLSNAECIVSVESTGVILAKTKYHYIYHWTRVHAYLVVEHSPGKADNKTLAINILCSSNYSNVKGSDLYMTKTLITMSTKVGYKNLVLEVGSERPLKMFLIMTGIRFANLSVRLHYNRNRWFHKTG